MILVTGGAGYIGSHTCVELLQSGRDVTVFDNFHNSHRVALTRVERITGRKINLIRGDIRDSAALIAALSQCGATSVIHFAGLKAVGESAKEAFAYYDNNVKGTVILVDAMMKCGVKTLLFSSSATVYGDPQHLPLVEEHPLSATTPYGRTKLFIENMLRDLYLSDPIWRVGILRYFNPAGAHESGMIGDNPLGTPSSLLPLIAQVGVGRRERLHIWGNDYATADGTGVRDYVHVVDLARGHRMALEHLEVRPECLTVNMGTGVGYSVLDMVRAFEHASGKKVPIHVAPRRTGDVASCYANPDKALKLLGWRAQRGLDVMCADAWRWQYANPNGYL